MYSVFLSSYRNTRERDVTKTENGEWGMGNGKWGIGHGEWEIDCFIFELFCAKIRETKSLVRARCLLVFSESD